MSTFYDQILCFGDSITQGAWDPLNAGWGAGLQHAYQRRLDVLARGFSGYTTEHAKVLLPQIIPKAIAENGSKILLLLLFFGANDATLKRAPQHVPLETYASNLEELLTSPLLTGHNPDIKLLLITPPPTCSYRCAERDREAGREPERTAEHTALYVEKAKSVAQNLKIPHVDLWMGFLREAGWKPGDPLLGSTRVPKSERLGELLPDGLHFSAEGNQLCFRLVFEKITEAYPELNPEKMETKVPLWDRQKDNLAILKERVAKFSG